MTNLIPKQRLDAKREQCTMRRWIGVCASYALLLAGVSVLAQTAWSTPDHTQAEQLQEIGERIERNSEIIGKMKPALAHAQLSLAIEQEIVSQPNWSILLALLGNTMGEDIVLRECDLTPLTSETQPAGPAGMGLLTAADGSIRFGAQHQLKLNGLGRSQSAISQFVLRLEETQLFNNVKLVNTMREPVMRDVEAFAFRIECVLGTAPPAPPKDVQEEQP